MAILRRSKHALPQIYAPQLRHVIDHDQVRVEVDDAAHARRQKIGEVDSRVVERLVQRAANRVRDLSLHQVAVEVVEVEFQVRECGGDDAAEVFPAVVRGDEMEDDVLGTRGVLENGEDACDRAPEVGGVQGHGDVDDGGVVGVRGPRSPGASSSIPKCRCFTELWKLNGGGFRRKLYGHDEDEKDCTEAAMIWWHLVLDCGVKMGIETMPSLDLLASDWGNFGIFCRTGN